MATRSFYEVMVQIGGQWVVQTSTQTQADALRLAERLVTTGSHEDVRVMQSFFDDKKRALVENELKRFKRKVAAKGDANPNRGTPLSGRPCITHLDFYRFESRRIIRSAMMDDLERWALTPLELLHSWPHAQRLTNSGTVLQGGVQRIAVVQSRESGQSIHQRMKALFEFCTEIERELRQIWRLKPVEGIPSGGLKDRLAALKDHKTFEFMVNAEVTESLREAKDWPGKLEKLLGLLSPAAARQEMAVFDRFASEIMESGAAIKALLGNIGDRADAILALLDIQAGIAPTDQAVAPVVTRLIALFGAGRLPECRAAMYRRIKQELESLRSVSGNATDLIRETQVLRALYEKLLRDAGELEDAQALLGTLEMRGGAILRSEALGTKLQAQRTPIGQIDLLLRLAPGILGDANKVKLAAFLIGLTDNEENRTVLLGDESATEQRMLQFRNWEDQARATRFGAEMEEELAATFDSLCVQAMRKTQFFQRLQRDEPVPSARALRLMELLAREGITTGVARKAVQGELIRLLKDAATLAALAEAVKNDPDMTARLRELYVLLVQQSAASA